ncbi:TatD family hydrolase [Neofamilia massiliensis]|uniref:TatD family hydrolase n=1 Tax=Neofamilia massiliensis TaxID=1673724 RepID=UPI0006BB7BBF|nr:TatD family hydrolase [Neofamilia massiliensis]
MIDAHGHLEDRAFDTDRDEILGNLKDYGIDYFFNCGSNIQTSKTSVDFAKKYDNVYAIVGIHPLDADEYSEDSLKIIRDLSKNEKVVAIGEIGLDNHYDDSPSPEVQEEAFLGQLDLAVELKMPVVIHAREADQKVFDILKSYKDKHEDFVALLHCFSGSVELMREYMKLGFYISLGGVTTFKNAKKPKEVAIEVPLDRLLLETDCPYMTPVPFRGKRNEPKYVLHTAKNIASLRGISLEELEKQTDANTLRFYRLSND